MILKYLGQKRNIMIRTKNHKLLLAIALGLVLAIILVFNTSVYAKQIEFFKVKGQLLEIENAKKAASYNAYVQMVVKESAKSTVEEVVEVAAAQPEEPVVETPVEEPIVEEPVVEEYYYEEPVSYTPDLTSAGGDYYSAGDLRFLGEIYSGGWRWTWYSQNVLPGGGLSIPGRYVDENGYVCDENGRICLASEDLPYGTVVATPFGKEGCVYDCGCDYGTLDVYVAF